MDDLIYMISGIASDAIENWDGYDSVGKPLGSVTVGFEHFLAANIVNSEEFDRWLASVKAEAWDKGFDEGIDYFLVDRGENPYRKTNG